MDHSHIRGFVPDTLDVYSFLSLPHVAYCRKVLSPVLATEIRNFTSQGIVSSGTTAMSDHADIDALVMISGSVHTTNRAF